MTEKFEYLKRLIEEDLKRKDREAQEAERNPKKQKVPKNPPPQIPQIPLGRSFFLGGDFGKQIHSQVISKYGAFDSIKCVVYDKKDKIVKGSTPFYPNFDTS